MQRRLDCRRNERRLRNQWRGEMLIAQSAQRRVHRPLDSLRTDGEQVFDKSHWAAELHRHCVSKYVDNLREFALCYERHPESVRVFAWLRAAGGVAGSAGARGHPRDPPACPDLRSLPRQIAISTSSNFASKSVTSSSKMPFDSVPNRVCRLLLGRKMVQKSAQNCF